MGENFDVLLRFLLDQQAKDGVVTGVGEITDSLGNVNKVSKHYAEAVKRDQETLRRAIQQTTQIIEKQATLLSRVSSQLNRFGTSAIAGGAAIVGGIVLEANRYAKEAGNATSATRQWNAQLTALGNSRRRIDETLVREALPLIEKAAQVADVASRFIQANPQLVTAALNTGVAVASLGVLAKVLAVPIKLVSDKLYYTAQIAQIAELRANTTQLMIANGVKNIPPGGAITGGVLAGTVASVLTAAVVVSAGVALGAVIYDKFIAKKVGGASVAEIATVEAYSVGDVFGKIGVAMKLWSPEQAQKQTERFAASVGRATGAIDKLSTSANSAASGGGIKGGIQKDTSFGAMANMPSDWTTSTVLQLRDLQASLVDLDTNYSATLSTLTTNFLQAQAAADAQYAEQRAQIIRDGGIEIERIEQDSQRRLAKLRLDHEDKMYTLNLQRDALGRAIELRDYARAQDEEEDNTNLEIKRRRQDIALRLSDLAKAYRAERNARLQQYQAQLQIAQQEYDAKRSAIVAEMNDLEYALTHERDVKNAYYAAILDDAAKFSAAYRATLAGAYPTTPSAGGSGHHMRAMGGYADYGNYLLGDSLSGGRGPREFVLSGRTTRAAEQMLGGLNQQKIIAALSGGSGGIHIVDNSKYAPNYSASERRAIRHGAVMDTMSIIGANK